MGNGDESDALYDSKGNLIDDQYVEDAIADVHRAIDEGRVAAPNPRAD
ncbi:hypothetical protein [Planotetraspora phitsanulokensis]|nr:hypothetical protein [Planotetraspora phitsanulokensis]